jgi:hypothetical protein
MKSLIEEASSIAKAVEKAWERAGNPQSFSIKIFELPEKNFIGMTTKYAKIGFFFEEKYTNSAQQSTVARKEIEQSAAVRPGSKPVKQSQRNQQTPPLQREVQAQPTKEKRNERPIEAKQLQQKNKQIEKSMPSSTQNAMPATGASDLNEAEVIATTTSVWQPEMLNDMRQWLRKTLDLIGLSNVDFTMQDDKQLLKINFDAPLIGNELKESILYKNISYLAMTSLRAHFKNDMKYLKIVFGRE